MPLIEVPVDDKGGSFLVEVSENDVYGAIEPQDKTVTQGFVWDIFSKKEKEVVIKEDLENIIKYMYSAFDSIEKPDEFSLEFGAKIVVGTGGLISAALTKLEGEMQVTVKATWKSDPPQPE